jgi:hypothetical protein
LPRRSSSAEPELDARDAVRDLPGHELEAATGLVVEEDPDTREEAV